MSVVDVVIIVAIIVVVIACLFFLFEVYSLIKERVRGEMRVINNLYSDWKNFYNQVGNFLRDEENRKDLARFGVVVLATNLTRVLLNRLQEREEER